MTCIDTGDQVRGVIVTVKGKNLCVNEYMIECIKLFAFFGHFIVNCIFKIIGADSTYDFKSRYFAPWVGIPEDPVTGSAHTVLAPYWSQILQKVYDV